MRQLRKSYRIGRQTLEVLRDVAFDLREREILAIVGQSGSGKSTLLHLLGLLDEPDAGTIRFRGVEVPTGGGSASHARSRHFGFVFQFYHLLPEFSALENVLMPTLVLEGWGAWRRHKRERKAFALELLTRMGLADRSRHKPGELSGGERQRVAIARALMNRPEILLCDEPTGNLDRKTALGVRDLLWEINRESGQAMILVTHDRDLAAQAHRSVTLLDGRLDGAPEAA
ncbi:MAG: ABC transporter ATP-binding protein [Planctomycetaceae bacterium]